MLLFTFGPGEAKDLSTEILVYKDVECGMQISVVCNLDRTVSGEIREG